jgi:hypothetical protein
MRLEVEEIFSSNTARPRVLVVPDHAVGDAM